LAIIDEQHKFGVRQRAKFSVSNTAPHVLVMTATPIPRSLCLTQFGDLDLTVINEMPPGRQRVVTSHIANRGAAQKAWDFIKKGLREGRQAYVVCPRVEEDAQLPDGVEATASAEAVFRQLTTSELKEFRIGLVHGRMDRRQRAATMRDFRTGKLHVLVATTVIEVGVMPRSDRVDPRPHRSVVWRFCDGVDFCHLPSAVHETPPHGAQTTCLEVGISATRGCILGTLSNFCQLFPLITSLPLS